VDIRSSLSFRCFFGTLWVVAFRFGGDPEEGVPSLQRFSLSSLRDSLANGTIGVISLEDVIVVTQHNNDKAIDHAVPCAIYSHGTVLAEFTYSHTSVHRAAIMLLPSVTSRGMATSTIEILISSRRRLSLLGASILRRRQVRGLHSPSR
jgi:hypothetical protein